MPTYSRTSLSNFSDIVESAEPKSVLIMDNASFHLSDRIEGMCAEAGVKSVYLPPYSPDLNPIEEFFFELKAFISRHWLRNHFSYSASSIIQYNYSKNPSASSNSSSHRMPNPVSQR